MSFYYHEPPLVVNAEDYDVYFFVDGYEESSTDPPMTILVEYLVNELMGSSAPVHQDSKYYAIGGGDEHGRELSESEVAERMDFFINEKVTKYKANMYELSHLERSTECGASGVMETVTLAILSGAVGGIASVITAKLFEIYGGTNIALSADEIHELIQRMLKSNYGASGEVACVSAKKDGIERKYTYEDENKTRYYVRFMDNDGVKSVRVKR